MTSTPGASGMPDAPYDAIAEWYDEYVRTEPLLYEVVIPATLRLVEETGSLEDAIICDLACGQGVIARELALRGAHVTGVDISERLLTLARSQSVAAPHAISWRHDDAQVGRTLRGRQLRRRRLQHGADGYLLILPRPCVPSPVSCALGGWFVFSITHPCVQMPHSAWITQPDGATIRGSGDYFTEGFWRPASAPGVRGRVGAHHRTLSAYLNALRAAGLIAEHTVEPSPPRH